MVPFIFQHCLLLFFIIHISDATLSKSDRVKKKKQSKVKFFFLFCFFYVALFMLLKVNSTVLKLGSFK